MLAEPDLAVREHDRKLGSREPGAALAPFRQLLIVRQELERAIELARTLQRIHQLLIFRQALCRAQLKRTDRLRLQIVVAQHETCYLVRHAREQLVAPGTRQAARGDQWIQQDLDIDLEVRGIDAAGVVDEVRVQTAAAQSILNAAALRESEIAAFADHPGGKLGAIHAYGIIAAIADLAIRLAARLDVGTDAAIPKEINGHAQNGANDFARRGCGLRHAEHRLRLG